jgi:hypothetical protein
MVRETIKQVINHVREEHPSNLVRVTIDTGKCCFNISRRPVNNADGNADGSKAIPEVAFDVDTKRVPADFKISWPLADLKKNHTAGDDDGDMEVANTTEAL